jgi:deoxyribodipyrimidine photo-lyase
MFNMVPERTGSTSAPRCTIVLFTRDLRVHDHPALWQAARTSDHVVPLFVFDDALLGSDYATPNRVRFLLESLADLDRSLRALGGRLVVRRGDPVREVVAVAREAGAQRVFASGDVSAFARRRQRRLALACTESGLEWRVFPGVTVVPPEALRPASADHFRVFTPYWNRWRSRPLRVLAPTPGRLNVPSAVALGVLPGRSTLVRGTTAPDAIEGGESAGRARLEAWGRSGVEHYAERHDALAVDGTSHLSAYLHFGCLSPVEVASRCRARDHGEAFLRQLCWRDFHHQVTAAFPSIAREDYRPRGDRWQDDDELLAAWKAGRTGYPLVDAGMRQLMAEGFMPNRARLVTASFLVKDLGLDWRAGARHFLDLLVDGDIANNSGNWQWVAGTGNDPRPHRLFNPVRQAERFDPDGAYVRRWVPELASLEGTRVHTPWRLDPRTRERLGYGERLVDHEEVTFRPRVARR